MVNCVLLNFFHVLLQQWKVTGQPPTRPELFAFEHSLEHFRPYLLGRKLTVITDHANLQWPISISPQQSKLAHWSLPMAEFDFKIEHRAGSANVIPDVLSRAPLTHPSTTGDDLFLSQPVTCFLTSLIGFDISYLDPSHVSEFLVMPSPASPLHATISPPSMPYNMSQIPPF